jgi:short-subunit dehydrogenase
LDWILGVNLRGTFNAVRAFLPLIREQKDGGQIVATASVFGLFAGALYAGYTISKFAVLGMMESLRAELEHTGIGVSVFCPGLVSSNLHESARNRPRDLSHSEFGIEREVMKQERADRSDPDLAMDPLQAGRLLLRGMRNNDLYILTHPEFEREIRDRGEALLSSIPRDLKPSQKRVASAEAVAKTSIYYAERERKECIRRTRSD